MQHPLHSLRGARRPPEMFQRRMKTLPVAWTPTARVWRPLHSQLSSLGKWWMWWNRWCYHNSSISPFFWIVKFYPVLSPFSWDLPLGAFFFFKKEKPWVISFPRRSVGNEVWFCKIISEAEDVLDLSLKSIISNQLHLSFPITISRLKKSIRLG